ncbi:MAG: hypothetical protein KDJ16_13405, partial [Hyphomicrobiales bacterium]|nr:hypothetical protein [Hyphomicrobiales bacterium]
KFLNFSFFPKARHAVARAFAAHKNLLRISEYVHINIERDSYTRGEGNGNDEDWIGRRDRVDGAMRLHHGGRRACATAPGL